MITYVLLTVESGDRRPGFSMLLKGSPEKIGEKVSSLVASATRDGSRRITVEAVAPSGVFNVDKDTYGE